MRRGFSSLVLGFAASGFCENSNAKPLSELRILVARVPRVSPKDFVFGGQALMGPGGKPVRSDKVRCNRETAISANLLSGERIADSKVSWRCRANSNSWTVKGPLSFKDRSGFMNIGKKWYRGSLELDERGDSLWVINVIGVESYLAGLLHGEMPRFFEPEALKAQAVAARSYAVATALERRAEGALYDMTDNPRDQMYPGAHSESEKGGQAVLATADEYLLLGTRVLKSFYHAASGGHSELPANVWGVSTDEFSYGAFDAQPNPWDKGHYAWNTVISPSFFSRFPELGSIVDIRITKYTEGFRVGRVLVSGTLAEKELSILELEKIFGPSWLKSRKFEIVKERKNWKINGEGWGHGVGLSQVAANNMAKAGKNYREILEFHYPKATIKKLDDESELKSLAGTHAH